MSHEGRFGGILRYAEGSVTNVIKINLLFCGHYPVLQPTVRECQCKRVVVCCYCGGLRERTVLFLLVVSTSRRAEARYCRYFRFHRSELPKSFWYVFQIFGRGLGPSSKLDLNTKSKFLKAYQQKDFGNSDPCKREYRQYRTCVKVGK